MTLADRLALHRAMLRDELTFSPSQRTPPVDFTWSDTERAMVPDDRPLAYFVDGAYIEVPDSPTQSTQVGMPMSARMLRYLAGPSSDTPWSAGLKALRFWCRREHPTHRGATEPYWRGSLCHQLVFLTIIGKPLGTGPASIPEAARILRYDNPEPLLREALDFIEDSIDRARERAERRAAEYEGRFTLYDAAPVHHAPSPEHIAECPNPECRARRAA